jgi:hypothetical protein
MSEMACNAQAMDGAETFRVTGMFWDDPLGRTARIKRTLHAILSEAVAVMAHMAAIAGNVNDILHRSSHRQDRRVRRAH